MNRLILFFLIIVMCGCDNSTDVGHNQDHSISMNEAPSDHPYIIILGIAQDAGYPQIACHRHCCKDLWGTKVSKRMVSSLALVDPISQERWIFDATPDLPGQLDLLNKKSQTQRDLLPSGIFLTHAHIGHYTGLMYLGREAYGAKDMPVYAMPEMKSFLSNNGPWSQLVDLHNIDLHELKDESPIHLNERIIVTPFLVPHRDEYSETVGYKITTLQRSLLYIPDINKWQDWDRDINQMIEECDLAFLDGSFYKNGEIPDRDMSLIPHPFIEESMNQFASLKQQDKEKIRFIHFNHTNPVLVPKSDAFEAVKKAGYNIAIEGNIHPL